MDKKEYFKRWREENRERIKVYQKKYTKKWRDENPEYLEEWRKKNPNYYKKYSKEYYEQNKERFLALQKGRYKKNPDYYKEYMKEWHKRNPECEREYMKERYKVPEYREKHLARAAADRAINSGKLVRLPCENCGAQQVEAHHDDYNKPLDVRWLCKKCHAEWHKNNTPIY